MTWLVNVLGTRAQHEVSVVKDTFAHGFQSWGWEGHEKLIVSSVYHCKHHLDAEGYAAVKASAQRLADKLNSGRGTGEAP